ncbi:Formamidopyrimidine-DNA glycosylase catalytic domain protein [Emticicia oligotrophica DSM 17448]|uniref:Formamidopyrimidine-DNA glycosylase catalytic domain protein n=1 Tax=Emticicia oligotrophica (strain DSM 17448 / CIP 109782 / MTCC 6937 / GPTSA100-15) TaxID=929562 RepID=A0ABM5N414_EMTOG|nr:DNA-formamidopyrimidine glycosylase family protein [Emticicia oligotrophica]AFK04214.1 Formamidopyrimidine-DNA glycosylase catalytic domain protein [Emticicia oligotrophica DSM 17448]
MPELPEVETYRRYFEETSLFQPIADVFVEDTKLLTTDYDLLIEKLRNKQFIGTKRIGKNLFIQLDAPYWLHFHFGMTGDLAYFRDEEDTPRFARIVFKFANGFKLGFLCPRKFERIGIVENIEEYLLKKKINKDALEISIEELAKTLKKKNAPIKSVLLDQSTVAGIGNWIVDDVLFQAKIHPERSSNQLSNQKIIDIHQAIKLVIQTAIDLQANYNDFPKNFLIHARGWGIQQQTLIGKCPACGEPISISKVGGRTTFFCSKRQVL